MISRNYFNINILILKEFINHNAIVRPKEMFKRKTYLLRLLQFDISKPFSSVFFANHIKVVIVTCPNKTVNYRYQNGYLIFSLPVSHYLILRAVCKRMQELYM